jgi:hypothetical protein
VQQPILSHDFPLCFLPCYTNMINSPAMIIMIWKEQNSN